MSFPISLAYERFVERCYEIMHHVSGGTVKRAEGNNGTYFSIKLNTNICDDVLICMARDASTQLERLFHRAYDWRCAARTR